jgi:hypothetical protein
MLPSLEFWMSGQAIIGAFTTAYGLILALIGLKGSAGTPAYKVAGCLLLLLIAAQWWALAKQGADKAKPERDYAYFLLSQDARDFREDGAVLVTVASGVLRNIRVAIQRTSDHNAGRWNYIWASEIGLIDEGTHRTGLVLPFGDYTIDIDAPSKSGKVLQRLDIVGNNGRPVILSTTVRRKDTREILCELPQRAGSKPCL